MAEPYIIRPRSYNYKSGYEYDDANHKPNLAFDNDMNTYWLMARGMGSGDRTFYNFDFSQIPSHEKITDLVIHMRQKVKPSSIYYMVKKGFSGSYAGPSPDYYLDSFSVNGDSTMTIREVISPSLTNSVTYLNNNRSAYYGIYIFPTGTVSSSSPSEFYDIALYVYTDKSSLIFNGSSNITSAYLGSTPINAIYLGSQKLL